MIKVTFAKKALVCGEYRRSIGQLEELLCQAPVDATYAIVGAAVEYEEGFALASYDDGKTWHELSTLDPETGAVRAPFKQRVAASITVMQQNRQLMLEAVEADARLVKIMSQRDELQKDAGNMRADRERSIEALAKVTVERDEAVRECEVLREECIEVDAALNYLRRKTGTPYHPGHFAIPTSLEELQALTPEQRRALANGLVATGDMRQVAITAYDQGAHDYAHVDCYDHDEPSMDDDIINDAEDYVKGVSW